MKQAKGFTLIEVLVAVSVMAVAFAVIASSMGAVQRQGRDTARRTDLETLRQGLQQYYAENTFVPTSINFNTATSLQSDSSHVYISNLPKDPTANPHYCYIAKRSFETTSPTCDNSNPANSEAYCQYYELYARIEVPKGDEVSNAFSCNGVTYNYRVTSR